MECLIKYLGSGKLYKYPGEKSAVVLTIIKFSDIINIIIPFFFGKSSSPLGSAPV